MQSKKGFLEDFGGRMMIDGSNFSPTEGKRKKKEGRISLDIGRGHIIEISLHSET